MNPPPFSSAEALIWPKLICRRCAEPITVRVVMGGQTSNDRVVQYQLEHPLHYLCIYSGKRTAVTPISVAAIMFESKP